MQISPGFSRAVYSFPAGNVPGPASLAHYVRAHMIMGGTGAVCPRPFKCCLNTKHQVGHNACDTTAPPQPSMYFQRSLRSLHRTPGSMCYTYVVAFNEC